MGFWGLASIAVGLSMDAFAVALCKGLCMKRMRWKSAAVIALFFGVFQAGMPLIGWLIGKQFETVIVAIDHWVAFVLLSILGVKMIYEALHPDKDEVCEEEALRVKELFTLAIATSIDALAVGIMFASLQVEILPSVALIGTTTFLLSLVGVYIGHRSGVKLMKKAEIGGGAILIGIGIKILTEHLLG